MGAAPLKVFFVITLPMIMPAVVSGWLLAFTLSLDDRLLQASFWPGATTLPMLVFQRAHGVNLRLMPATFLSGVVGIVGFIAPVFDGLRGKAAGARYPARKKRLNQF